MSTWDYNSPLLGSGTMGITQATQLGYQTAINGFRGPTLQPYTQNVYVAGANSSGSRSFMIGLTPGTFNNFVAEDGGYIATGRADAIFTNAIINSGGLFDVVGAGTLISAAVTAGGTLFAGNSTDNPYARFMSQGAGTAIAPHVGSGATAITGGGENGFHTNEFQANGTGGLIYNGIFDPGSTTFIGHGGNAWGGTVGGVEYVLSDGVSLNQTFSGGRATQLTNGGTAQNAAALQGATLYVSGATGSNLSSYNGGTILVASGRYVTSLTSDNTASSAAALTSGITNNNQISSGGTEIISAGGTSVSAMISSGGVSTTFAGGTSMSPTISSGGISTVLAGGAVYNGTAIGGTEIFSSGGVFDSVTASNSGSVIINSGAAGNIVTTTSDGVLLINGGTINQSTISGGTGSIFNGGTTVATVVAQGGTLLISSGTVLGATNAADPRPALVIDDGTAILQNGAVAQHGLLINRTGLVTFSSGATANSIQANGGTAVVLSGATLGTLHAVISGTGLITNNGASVTSAVAGIGVTAPRPGGTIFISNGGTANYATAAYTGTVILGNNGVINNSFSVNAGTGTILSGGYVGGPITVTGTAARGLLYVGPRQEITTSVFASNGGTVSVDSTTRLDSLYTGPQGTVLLSSGAAILDYNMSGGTNSITSGALAVNLSVSGGGTGLVNSQGTVVNMTLTNGYGTIASGATVANLTISSGASGVLMPGAAVFNLQVNSGGWVSGAQVNAASTMTVLSGGTAVNTSVLAYNGNVSNQSVTAFSGAEMDNATIVGQVTAQGSTKVLSSGGLLSVQSGASLYNTSMGFNARLRVLGLKYSNNNNVTYQGGTLTVTENGQTWSMTLTGDYHGQNAADTTGGFALTSDDQGNTIITYTQCFLTGSMIRTPKGDVAVEKLRKGDQICTYVDDQEIIKTLTSVVQRRAKVNPNIPEDLAGWSVIISKGAFSENVPSQDLSVTPEHCFYFQGRFIPARMLINGKTIRYDHSQEEYDYYHVETEQHSIIWANDALTESWLNTHDTAELLPEGTDTARLVERQKITWNENAAAPLDVSQGFVKPIYDELLERARQITQPDHAHNAPEPTTTNDPAPYLRLENGEVIRPLRQQGNRYIFNIPALTSKVMVGSRFFRPSEAVGPYLDDRRQLGILVGAISLWHGTQETAITCHLNEATLTGWDIFEQGPHRWTNAEAELHLHEEQDLRNQAELLSIEVLAGGPYKIA